jgi:hypothetical protein
MAAPDTGAGLPLAARSWFPIQPSSSMSRVSSLPFWSTGSRGRPAPGRAP